MTAHTTSKATLSDARWLLDLSHRVQTALTASGSQQQLTIPPLPILENTITDGHVYMFFGPAAKTPIGAVTISPFSPEAGHGSWEWVIEPARKGKIWYLHSLMVEPETQGQGFGLVFLKEVVRSVGDEHGDGLLVLDCWAGNENLREFYRQAGFRVLGQFPEGEYEIVVFVAEVDGRVLGDAPL